MSAIALDIDHLPPETHRAMYKAIKEDRGQLWAETIVGPLDKVVDPFFEASNSIESECCIKCNRKLEDYELIYSVYEYDDGEPAFYLCAGCEDGFMSDMFLEEDNDED